jgi:hypothetical protein
MVIITIRRWWRSTHDNQRDEVHPAHHSSIRSSFLA